MPLRSFPSFSLAALSPLLILGNGGLAALGALSPLSAQEHVDPGVDHISQSVLQTNPLQDLLTLSFRQPNTQETGAPLDRPRGGGSRGPGLPTEDSCDNGNVCIDELTALVPFPDGLQPQQPTPLAWGQTLEAQPTLWFYIPYDADDVYAAEFELWTAEGDRIIDTIELPLDHRIFHTTTIPTPEAPGIIGYTLPETVALEKGETYRWHLVVQLGPLPSAADAIVSGRIERVSLPAHEQQILENSSLAEQARLLADSGIWYDLLSTMVMAYAQDSVTWQTTWHDVLTDVGLADSADAPLSDAWTLGLEEVAAN